MAGLSLTGRVNAAHQHATAYSLTTLMSRSDSALLWTSNGIQLAFPAKHSYQGHMLAMNFLFFSLHSRQATGLQTADNNTHDGIQPPVDTRFTTHGHKYKRDIIVALYDMHGEACVFLCHDINKCVCSIEKMHSNSLFLLLHHNFSTE